MNHYSIIIIALSALLIILWLWESRIFLILWYRLVFLRTKNPPFIQHYSDTIFPQSRVLEYYWTSIRDEFIAQQKQLSIPKFHEIDQRQSKISMSDGPAWRTVLLKAHGAWFEDNCKRFPLTHALLAQCPNVSTALISILEPGTKIPAHTGKFKGVLRYQLALQVPKEGDCFLRVHDQFYRWQAGKGVLFDDVYEHEVQNNSDEYRVVLFLDVQRPMPFILKWPDRLVHIISSYSPKYLEARRAGRLVGD
jgi:beta-hydroxylase